MYKTLKETREEVEAANVEDLEFYIKFLEIELDYAKTVKDYKESKQEVKALDGYKSIHEDNQ